jgi:hypothetical protein
VFGIRYSVFGGLVDCRLNPECRIPNTGRIGYNAGVRHRVLVRVQRIIVGIIVLALLGIALVGARVAGIGVPGLDSLRPPGSVGAALGLTVALVSGHAGNDSGATGEDDEGNTTLTEAAVNAEVATRAVRLLQRAGANVLLLEEFDPRLDDLRADALLSIHADSCIEASGFKAASYVYSTTGAADARLVACINDRYAAVTGLPHHPNTVTHNMTQYHAFRKIAPTTPAAILELGFLGGDRDLLERRPELAAQGVIESLLCFVRGDDPAAGEAGPETGRP